MAQHAADDMLRIEHNQLRCDRVTQLVDGVAVPCCAFHHIHQVRGFAELNPLIMEGVIGYTRAAIRAEQYSCGNRILAERAQPGP